MTYPLEIGALQEVITVRTETSLLEWYSSSTRFQRSLFTASMGA